MLVLIDTWWNVNSFELVQSNTDGLVLIDTWWNVNFRSPLFLTDDCLVLIDTWWNVNTLLNYLLYWGYERFNRYMVECESY